MDQSFRPREHLRSEGDFRTVYTQGGRLQTDGFILYCRPNGLDHCRLGVVANRHYGKAVKRNRVKRLMRESYRLNRQLLTVSCDIILKVVSSDLRPKRSVSVLRSENLPTEPSRRTAEHKTRPRRPTLATVQPEIRKLFQKADERLTRR